MLEFYKLDQLQKKRKLWTENKSKGQKITNISPEVSKNKNNRE